MEFLLDIIDLIFSNIFFVALIIGGIMSMFKRQSQSTEERKQRTEQVPPHQPEQQPKQAFDLRDIFQQFDMFELEEEKKVEEKKEVVPKPVRTRVEPKIEKIEPKLERKEQVIERQPVKEVEPIKQVSGIGNFTQLTSDDIVKGIVLAEILGPPRSRQKLNTLRRR